MSFNPRLSGYFPWYSFYWQCESIKDLQPIGTTCLRNARRPLLKGVVDVDRF
jgi:hypothetical protein